MSQANMSAATDAEVRETIRQMLLDWARTDPEAREAALEQAARRLLRLDTPSKKDAERWASSHESAYHHHTCTVIDNRRGASS